MSVRVTILLDDDLAKSLRRKQGKLLMRSKKNISFSAILNQTLRKSLKK